MSLRITAANTGFGALDYVQPSNVAHLKSTVLRHRELQGGEKISKKKPEKTLIVLDKLREVHIPGKTHRRVSQSKAPVNEIVTLCYCKFALGMVLVANKGDFGSEKSAI